MGELICVEDQIQMISHMTYFTHLMCQPNPWDWFGVRARNLRYKKLFPIKLFLSHLNYFIFKRGGMPEDFWLVNVTVHKQSGWVIPKHRNDWFKKFHECLIFTDNGCKETFKSFSSLCCSNDCSKIN